MATWQIVLAGAALGYIVYLFERKLQNITEQLSEIRDELRDIRSAVEPEPPDQDF